MISKPILHSTSKPLTTSNHPQQQRQTLPMEKKISEQSVDDFQLDSFDDTDSDSDMENKPTAKVVNSTPNVMDKKLPGLSFSFDKPPFVSQVTEEKGKETQAPNGKVSATEVTSDKPTPTMVDNPAPKETEGLATERVDVKKEDISSDFDSSPPISIAEDDQLIKQFSSDSDEDEDDIPTTAYVPSVASGLAKQSHRNPLTATGHSQQLATTEKEKEKDKILELAQSRFLEMEDTSRKSDSATSNPDKTGKSNDTVDTSSHNPGTFSPITPLTDQVDAPSMFPSDAKPTKKKTTESSGITDHAVGVVPPLSESDSSLNTDSVIRQAEEIERSMDNRDHKVQGKTDLKSAATTGHEKSDKQESEGN